MDIDITDLKSRDLVKLLTIYPQGHLEIKFERIFWCSDYAEPSLPRDAIAEVPRGNPYDPRTPPRGKGDVGQAFEKMGDALSRMVGPPKRN